MPPPKTPSLTADCVVLDAEGRVLLIKRKNPPFAGCYALPGGFVDVGETCDYWYFVVLSWLPIWFTIYLAPRL